MYFKSVVRKNPDTGEIEGYYRLVESYRNEYDRVCHRTLLNIGFIDYSVDTLVVVQRLINDKLKGNSSLFEEQDVEALQIANRYWKQLIEKGKVDVSDKAMKKQKRLVDVDSIKHKDAREIGAEWMCYQAVEQLALREKLESLGWSEQSIQLAITQIVSRAIYPYSESRTSRWIKENSAICEITGYPQDKITKDKLYQSALDLYAIKEQLEKHLSNKTNELFDLQDKIILYDLTNTYFEGKMKNSKLAQYNKNKSKEKRDDAKIVVLALVVNVEGFIKFSSVFEGKMSDDSTLPIIIEKLRAYTSNQKKAIVVLDAGIATQDNLALLKENGYDYVCVSRTKISNHEIDSSFSEVKIQGKAKQTISLNKVISSKHTDYLLKVHSTGKQDKEKAMSTQFEERFINEIRTIESAINKKGGTKKADKVQRRIGRTIQKYPSIAQHYDIEVSVEQGVAKAINLSQRESYQKSLEQLGTYFIRTNLPATEQKTVWDIYNTIREIESSFKCLKSDLDLRPIYHKNDNSTVAHLHLGLLAYWITNTIRYQLKRKNIKHNWKEIVRITNTQKVITTTGRNTEEETISIRRCTEPNQKVKEIYQALQYKNYPFTKRKSVLLNLELKKNESQYLWEPPDI